MLTVFVGFISNECQEVVVVVDSAFVGDATKLTRCGSDISVEVITENVRKTKEAV